ncbi:hypothetical protein L6452_14611 [Arctium lappa]|uniref:Uncharacterized protein n=1 Tax=Arctium lappa TaxID=4217 RepID=A0ACB9CLU3_ARCLA|nr:hypothetical protein L6452_14611 [Arctium lappa]
MFKSMGKHELAASCYRDLGEYARAGECFTLAGCYNDAAEAYAKGDQFSNCLSACKKGKLFSKGMQFIEYWKEHANNNSQYNEIEQITQEFLESCALYHYEHNHPISMMRFVRAFCSMESKRVFLRSIGCLDELLLLEEKSGHFLDAAEIVRSWGDVLKEADLLEKAGRCLEPTMLILWYVFFSSLWGNGNKGWPLKQFPQKEQLCKKAMSLSEKDSDAAFNGHICRELEILSDQKSSLSELKKHLKDSKLHRSVRGEMLSIWKILDAHLQWDSSWYGWEDELPLDITKHSEGMIFMNRVSVTTLVFYWNMWKDHVVKIFQCLGCLDSEEPDEHEEHIEFSLDYFGVRKQRVNGNMVFLLVSKDVDWIRTGGQKGLHEDGKRLTFDRSWLVFSIQSYWRLELVSVGIKVLETLEALHKLMSNGSAFHQSTCLLHIFEVSKFLLDCRYLNLTDNNKKTLDNFLEISTTYYDLVFPLDWRRSVSEDFISLKETRLSLDLLDEIIFQNVNNIEGDHDHASPRTIGKVMMILCLGYRKPIALYDNILRVLRPGSDWEIFVKQFWNGGLVDDVAMQFWHALHVSCRSIIRRPCGRSISSHSSVYLLDCVLFMTCLSAGFFFTAKSSFLQWFTHLGSTSTPSTAFSEEPVRSLANLVEETVRYKKRTESWIKKSNINPEDYHPLLVLKLVMLLCLVCLKVPDCCKALRRLLFGRKNVASLLPKKFVSDLGKRKKGRDLNLNADVVAEAFISVEDPLLLVSMENGSPRIHAPCAIFVDVRRCSRDEIMKVLFPTEKTHSASDSNEVLSETESSSGNTQHEK